MLKRYFWLAHVLLVTLAAALSAGIAKSYISAKLTMPIAFKPTQTSNTPMRQTRKTFADYQVIAKRNIFNANPPQNGQAQEPSLPAQQDIQATQLQLKLAGTVTGADNTRFAIIEDLSQRGTQAVYQIGDAIQNALIVEIRPECVVLDKGGQYESLCFQYDTEGTKTARRRPPPPPPPRETDDTGIVKVDDATWRVSRELILEQFGNLGELSTQARLMPYIVQGQSQGFRLTRLRRGSLLQKIGLQNGDVIQKVNGLDIRSPEEALQAFQQLQDASTIRLEILRRKRSTTLTYELR
jgi:general secretion pathway protein C